MVFHYLLPYLFHIRYEESGLAMILLYMPYVTQIDPILGTYANSTDPFQTPQNINLSHPNNNDKRNVDFMCCVRRKIKYCLTSYNQINKHSRF